MTNTTMPSRDLGNTAQLQARANTLRLTGLLAHWDQLVCDSARLAWVTELLEWEETERDQRSLERRLRSAHIGKFKPLADFEWDWPKRCDRQAIQELMTLSFMADASNVMLVGPNGVGKSMLACNLGHQALIQGRTVLFITAGQLLGDLAALDSDSALRRRLKHYAAPDLLLVDELGTCRIPTGTPICCLSSSVDATSAKARSSPPTGRSRSGTRCFPMRLVWCR
jgi:DNA replication protein DnaC